MPKAILGQQRDLTYIKVPSPLVLSEILSWVDDLLLRIENRKSYRQRVFWL